MITKALLKPSRMVHEIALVKSMHSIKSLIMVSVLTALQSCLP
jgi:hypothetical protein